VIRTFDDLNGPAADLVEGGAELGATVGTVGKDVSQPRVEVANRGQNQWRALAILNVSRMDDRSDQQAAGVGEQVALAPFDLLAGIIPPRGPPASVVLTDSLSITPALGLASRRSASRTRITSEWLIVCHNPPSRQR
jgi:hypothetical protein